MIEGCIAAIVSHTTSALAGPRPAVTQRERTETDARDAVMRARCTVLAAGMLSPHPEIAAKSLTGVFEMVTEEIASGVERTVRSAEANLSRTRQPDSAETPTGNEPA